MTKGKETRWGKCGDMFHSQVFAILVVNMDLLDLLVKPSCG